MKKITKTTINLYRIYQWVKNLLIFTPLFFSGEFTNLDKFLPALTAFIVFCLFTSAIYIFNDIRDVNEDRLHPKKKFRAIASGLISIRNAYVLFLINILLVVLTTFFFLPTEVFIVLAAYLLLNLIYSYKLKHVPIIDILLLASFYVLRIFMGSAATGIMPSSWLLLTAFFLALFLGTTKRYAELKNSGEKTRKVLGKYNLEFLKFTLFLSAFSSIVFYSFFTLTKSIFYEFSVIIVVVALLVYFYDFFTQDLIEDPIHQLLKNKYLLVVCLVWVIYIGVILYLKI